MARQKQILFQREDNVRSFIRHENFLFNPINIGDIRTHVYFIHLSKNEWKRIVDYINIYIVTSLLLVIAGHDQRQVYRRSGQNGRKFALASGGRVEVVAFVFCLWHERKRFAGQHNHFLELAKAKTIKVVA